MVDHAGTRLLADLADVTGLSAMVGEALAPLRLRDRGHDRGRVAVDLAVMLSHEVSVQMVVLVDNASTGDLAAYRSPTRRAPNGTRLMTHGLVVLC